MHENSGKVSRRSALRAAGVAGGIGTLTAVGAAAPPVAQASAALGHFPGGPHLEEVLARNGLLFNARSSPRGPLRYRGERVALDTYSASEYSYRATTFLELPGLGTYEGGQSAQGFTVYGDVGFAFYDTGYVRTIDLTQGAYISTFALPGGVHNAQNHAGQANFGVEYAVDGDEFPVLYLSSYLEKICYVLRITRTGAELVQTIRLSSGEKDSAGTYVALDAQAFFPDVANDKLVIKMGAVGPDGVKYKYWKTFDLPALDDAVDLYLFDEKKNDEFYIRTLRGAVPANRNFVNAGFAMNGKIYVLAGFSGATSSLLVIDYEKHKVLTDIRWDSELITGAEQEQCCWYRDSLLLNFNGADRLVRVTFD